MKRRSKPLLVVYYYEDLGMIEDDDVALIYEEFRRRRWTRDRLRKDLDVLVHCYGGDAHASYRIGQVLHDFAEEITFLVPFHATSGATLVALGGSQIRLGAYASLSPIDTRIGDIELAAIDSYKDFALECRRSIEDTLEDTKSARTTDVESVLLREMVAQETALGIGQLYRASSLTGHYAFRLIADYMFKDRSNRTTLAQQIADQLLRTYPSHNFVLDFHMAKNIDLPVVEMDDDESDRTKNFVEVLDGLTEEGIICKDTSEYDEDLKLNLKAPFFRLYNMNAKGKG